MSECLTCRDLQSDLETSENEVQKLEGRLKDLEYDYKKLRGELESSEARAECLSVALEAYENGTLLHCETLYDEQKADISQRLFTELSLGQLLTIETLYLK